MGKWNDEGAGVTFPPLPEAGLASVLSSWSGRGSLFEALSLPVDQREERRWTASDVRLRANRILLSRLDPLVKRWPRRTGQWLDHLPAAKTHARVVQSVPFSGVNWTESRRRFDWPPKAFVGKQTERSADMLVVQVLRWCTEQLSSVWFDVNRAYPDLPLDAAENVRAALALLELEPLASANPVVPARSDLIALRREGAPWGSVADVAHHFLEAEKSLHHLVFELLLPDDEIRWRLFHLAILGVVLTALKSNGCQVTSVRPLSAQSSGPNYEIRRHDGRLYHLWFEASGVWAFRGLTSPFVEATRGMKTVARNNGADLLLLDSNRNALILECKYSTNSDRVARNGYYQAVAYAAEASSRLVGRVVSVAVGPESVVPESSFSTLSVGKVGTVPPSAIEGLVTQFVGYE